MEFKGNWRRLRQQWRIVDLYESALYQGDKDLLHSIGYSCNCSKPDCKLKEITTPDRRADLVAAVTEIMDQKYNFTVAESITSREALEQAWAGKDPATTVITVGTVIPGTDELKTVYWAPVFGLNFWLFVSGPADEIKYKEYLE